MDYAKIMRWLAGAIATFGLGAAMAQTAPSQPSWGCWVSNPEGRLQVHYLRCVVMNEAVQPTAERTSQPDWQLLSFLRVLIKAGRVERIERLLDDTTTRLPYGSLWQSRIDGYPLDEEWTGGWPEQLARAMLCVDPVACEVFVRRQ